MTYRGCNLTMDIDNNILVHKNGKYIGQFEDIEAAQTYIDDMPDRFSNSSFPKEKLYCIFLKGTYSRNRAQYLSKRLKRCIWSTEANADTYTKREVDAIMKNSKAYDYYELNH